MLVLQPNDQLGAKVDAGTDVNANASGIDVTQSSGLGIGVTSADALTLSTTAAALLTTPAAGHHYIIPVIKFVNTGTSTRTVTVYVERGDATPEWATANIWHTLVLAAGEFAEWTSGGWIVYDANGVPKFASASWPTIPEGATPPTPPTGYIRPFAKTTHQMAMVDALGIVSDFMETARHVNYLINGEFDYAQRQAPATATTYSNTSGRTYGADRFGVTNENASITYARVDTSGAPESGLQSRYYGKYDKITALGKVVVSQVIEAGNCLHLRGRTVRLQLKLKANVAMTIRVALLQLAAAGTIDTIPATFVSAFGANATDPTFGTNLAKIAPTAGQADNATIANSGLSCSATTAWQRFGAPFLLPTDFKNLVVVIFSDSQVATTDDFEIAEVGLYDGPETREWTPRPQGDQLNNCQRYYTKTFNVDTNPAQNAGALTGEARAWSPVGASTAFTVAWTWEFPVRMFKAPTLTILNPQAANAQVRNQTLGTDCTASTATANGETRMELSGTTPASTAVGNILGAHVTADAEL